MTRGSLPALAALEIADAPDVWRKLGFTVGTGDVVTVGGVELRLTGRGAGEGITAWELRAAQPLPEHIDGIPTVTTSPPDPGATAAVHANGALALDHLVVSTPDLPQTLAALTGIGLEVRRTREAGSPERPLTQAFLWAGDVLLEVAGPMPAKEGAAASLWGLVIVVPDFDGLTANPHQPVGKIRPAVQQGRQIATVRREIGSTVPLAFMTPHRNGVISESEAERA